MSRPRWNPAFTTIAFVLGVAAAAALLSWVTRLGADTDQDLVQSAEFGTWIAVAAFAVVAFSQTLVAGVRGLRSSRPRRPSSASLGTYVGLFVVFAAVVVPLLRIGGRGGPEVDVQYWTAINVSLLLLGVAAAGPWVVSVWAAHDVLGDCRGLITALPAASDSDQPSELDAMLHLLLDIRKVIAAAVGRLLILVLGAVVLSGALHAALVPDFIPEDDFPASAVLIYGGFFTIMLSLAVLPLMVAWRQTARMLLDQAYPARVKSSTEDAEARARMSQRLDLDGSLFTSPVTLTSVLAPLVTSFLAIFIPQIGQ